MSTSSKNDVFETKRSQKKQSLKYGNFLPKMKIMSFGKFATNNFSQKLKLSLKIEIFVKT